MDTSILISNIEHLSEKKGVKPTKALIESGAGKDFIANLLKGQIPSVEKVMLISNYFNAPMDYLVKGIIAVTAKGSEKINFDDNERQSVSKNGDVANNDTKSSDKIWEPLAQIVEIIGEGAENERKQKEFQKYTEAEELKRKAQEDIAKISPLIFNKDISLSGDERKLIAGFSQLNDAGKAVALGTIQSLALNKEYKKEAELSEDVV